MKAITYTNNHIYENLSSQELAQMTGLSYSQFSRRFLKAVGSSFTVYLNHVKVIQAQILLTNTKDSIEKISADLGFCNPNYFCSVFRKYTGLSPKAYRKMQAE
jgi:YesN/AraC family two-component response regulator